MATHFHVCSLNLITNMLFKHWNTLIRTDKERCQIVQIPVYLSKKSPWTKISSVQPNQIQNAAPAMCDVICPTGMCQAPETNKQKKVNSCKMVWPFNSTFTRHDLKCTFIHKFQPRAVRTTLRNPWKEKRRGKSAAPCKRPLCILLKSPHSWWEVKNKLGATSIFIHQQMSRCVNRSWSVILKWFAPVLVKSSSRCEPLNDKWQRFISSTVAIGYDVSHTGMYLKMVNCNIHRTNNSEGYTKNQAVKNMPMASRTTVRWGNTAGFTGLVYLVIASSSCDKIRVLWHTPRELHAFLNFDYGSSSRLSASLIYFNADTVGWHEMLKLVSANHLKAKHHTASNAWYENTARATEWLHIK